MKRVLFALTLLAGMLGLAKPAAADTFTFDYNGSTGPNTVGQDILSVNQFDWWPGNSILLEDSGTILFQANLDVNPSTSFCTSSALYDCFTAVASFTVTPTATPGQFTITSGTFNIYATSAYCDDLTGGSCFDSGTLVLSSSVIAPFGTASFTADGTTAPVDLDQFNANDWANILTVSGSGGFANILTSVTFANSNYFLDMTTGSVITTTVSAGSNNLPFTKVDPTALFFNGQPGVPSVGAINGTTSNIMTESDAATTIDLASPVPEPATLTLLGLGLAGTAAARRRQLKNRKQ